MTARRRDELRLALERTLGQEEAATLMEHLPPDRWDELAKKDDLERFATKDDLTQALARYVTKDDLTQALEPYATKDDLTQALEPYATKDDLTQALEPYATKDDMAQLEIRMDLKLDAMSHKLEALFRERVDHSTRVTVFAVLTAMLTSTGLSLGVVMLGA